MSVDVIVEPIASEDINWKEGSKQSAETFTRTTSTGGEQVVHKVSALTIPLEDIAEMWPAYDISTIEELVVGWINGTAPILNKGNMLQVRMNLLNDLAGLIGTDSLGKVVTELPWGHCLSMHPVGSIIPWMPGYFTGTNETFVRADFLATELAVPSLVTACNNFLNQYGWWVCDGTAPFDSDPTLSDSPIWNAPGKKVPLLTDERFLMGVSGPVTIGEGQEWEEETWADGYNGHHIHGLAKVTMDALTLPHKHHLWPNLNLTNGIGWMYIDDADALYDPYTSQPDLAPEEYDVFVHDHGWGGDNQMTAFNDDVENGTTWESTGKLAKETQGIDNRPKWLGVIYIIRVR
jgi:hypothetical protein